MAETLKQMAKRLCNGMKCENCPIGADYHKDTCAVYALMGLTPNINAEKQFFDLMWWAAQNPPEPPKTWRSELLRLMPWFEKDNQIWWVRCPDSFFPWMEKECHESSNDCLGCWDRPYVERSEDDAHGGC